MPDQKITTASPIWPRAVRLLVVLTCASVATAHAQFVITEFQASNNGIVFDLDGETSDWIELTNDSAAAASLQGWSLTDDADDATKWVFPDLTLDVGEVIVLFASGKNRRSADDELHTNFRLAAGGGYLALVKSNGDIASEFHTYPSQPDGYSLGTAAGRDGTLVFFPTPTPGETNADDGFLGFLEPIAFTKKRGVYDSPFQLELIAGNEETVWFTTDGSDPGDGAGDKYTAPLDISATTIVRAIVERAGFVPAPSATHTYLFPEDVVVQSADGVAPAGWPARSLNQQEFYYQMHPDVVEEAGQATIVESLRSLPSLSLVTPLPNLIDRATGIYVNPENRGRAWERPGSLELLDPEGEDSFQSGCGIRIRGGISRDPNNPKHSFRLLFRGEYGDGKLKWPMFGDEGVNEFDNLDLRTSTNWNWGWFGNFRPGAVQNTFLRDIVSRDLQGEMGMAYTRSRYYHLYLNGVYWGIYMTQERSEASYASEYLGGNSDDYDVVKVNRGSGAHTEATDGDLDAWRALSQEARRHRSNPTLASYFKMQGLGESGIRDDTLPVLLDVDALIDYMLAIFWTANNDAPISQWGDNDWSNNWYGIRNRVTADSGFRYMVHDAENTFGISGYDLNFSRVITTLDRTGPYNGSAYRSGDFNMYNPQFLHQDLLENQEYRLRFADRTQRFCFHDGALTDAAVMSLVSTRKSELAPAIVAQAARWGSRFASQGFRYNEATWEAAVAKIEEFVEGRTEVLLQQLARDELLSEIEAPLFNRRGGSVPKGFVLTMTTGELGSFDAGEVYYTTDGTDPRQPGGALATGAQMAVAEGFDLAASTRLLARVRATRDGDDVVHWSALEDVVILVDAVPADESTIEISEIHYHPVGASETEVAAGFGRGANFEFIELHNPGSIAISLGGLSFVDGITYSFANDGDPQSEIPPGGYAALVNNEAAFRFRYGDGPRILGEFSGDLSNGGERVVMLGVDGTAVAEVQYDDKGEWPRQADGGGGSLALLVPGVDSGSDAADWGASFEPGGSPGRADTTWYDSDGDGSDDRSEWISGTDPNDSTSVFAVNRVARRTESVELRCQGIAGRRYTLAYSTGAGPIMEWIKIGAPQAPLIDGELVFEDTTPARLAPGTGYYRISVDRL